MAMQEQKTIEEPRIGVFVCHCGTNIGGVVDVESVAEYAKTLPGVAFAMTNLYTCAEDGLASIRDSIKEHNLNRVIVASCTPRTHAPLFQATVGEAGLNKYLFTFVNIREHCSWVHMKEKDAATEKAKGLIRMGVARARLLTPQEEPRLPVEKSALVIGGGVAGMAAALSIAKQGFPVHLVEKEKELGGFVKNLNNLYVTTKDAMESIKPFIQKVTSHPNIKLYLDSKVSDVYGYIGNFEIKIDTAGKETKTKVGTIIVATGATEYSKEGLYGYNVYKNVVTLAEFELMCKKKILPKAQRFAFIQCVGSRGQDKSYCSRICCNVAIKNAINIVDNYGNMLQISEQAKKVVPEVPVEPKAPEEILDRRRRRRGRGGEEAVEEEKLGPGEKMEVTVFNRDVMSYGLEHELIFNKAREKRVRFVRYTPDRRPAYGQILPRDSEGGEGDARRPCHPLDAAGRWTGFGDALEDAEGSSGPGRLLPRGPREAEAGGLRDGWNIRRWHGQGTGGHHGSNRAGRGSLVKGGDAALERICPGRGAVSEGRHGCLLGLRDVHRCVPVRRADEEGRWTRRNHRGGLQGLRLLRRIMPGERDHDDKLHGRAADCRSPRWNQGGRLRWRANSARRSSDSSATGVPTREQTSAESADTSTRRT
jgi:hypothetical protein